MSVRHRPRTVARATDPIVTLVPVTPREGTGIRRPGAVETRLLISDERDAGGVGSTAVGDSTGAYATYRWRHDPVDDRFVLLGGTGTACATCPPTGVRYRYRDDFQLEAEVFGGDRERRYGYDGSGRLAKIEGPSGDGVELVYDAGAGRPNAVRHVRPGSGGAVTVHPILFPATTATRAGATTPEIGRRHRLPATTHRARDQGRIAACMAGGAVVGGVVGRGVGTTVGAAGGVIVGGTVGTVALPGGGTIAGGGIGGAAGGAAGGTVGAAGGAAVGGTIGGFPGTILCSGAADEEAGPDAPPIPGTYDPPPGGDEECARLKARVDAAKQRPADLGGCKAGMSERELGVRRAAWLEAATARSIFNQKCWSGGDPGHQRALAQAWQSIRNCDVLLP